MFIRITAYNRGPEPATLHIVPQVWFKNTWSWPAEPPVMPNLCDSTIEGVSRITARHPTLGKIHLYCMQSPPPVGPATELEIEPDVEGVEPELLFTENSTNFSRLYGGLNATPYVKDAFHDHIIPEHRPAEEDEKLDSRQQHYFVTKIHARVPSELEPSEEVREPQEGPCTPFPPAASYVNPAKMGTKSAAHYVFNDVPGGGGCAVVRLKLTPVGAHKDPSIFDEGIFDDTLEERREEADEFYDSLVVGPISDDFRQIMRQAFGGLLWTKQYYQFIHEEWIGGDPAQPPPPPQRKYVRNRVIKFPFPRRSSLSNAMSTNRNGVICTFPISCLCPTSEFLHSLHRRVRFSLHYQMGVSLFCSLGHGVSLHPSRDC
jgi:hypothetical protein